MSLQGKICLVTGASRGIGKGIAVQLGEAGATVIVTGRAPSNRAQEVGGTLEETANEITSRGGRGIAMFCDHSKEEDIAQLFDKISANHGRLDILVNNAYAAVTGISREVKAGNKFWQYEGPPGEWWDLVNNVGLRNHYICSTYAARMMVPAKSGLIVNVSSPGGIVYLFNVAYGVGKAALDRMSADMAVELKRHNVACITLYPGPVLTEHIEAQMAKDKSNLNSVFVDGETPEFSGKAVVALATDPNVINRTGKIQIVADLSRELGFTDVGGVTPPSLRQVNYMLRKAGYNMLASLVPNFVKFPGFMLAMRGSKF